jgi:hypothetical protein
MGWVAGGPHKREEGTFPGLRISFKEILKVVTENERFSSLGGIPLKGKREHYKVREHAFKKFKT